MDEGGTIGRGAGQSVFDRHSTIRWAAGGKPTFYRTTKERRCYPTEAHQPIELVLRLTRAASTA
jgi:hypothetical protein